MPVLYLPRLRIWLAPPVLVNVAVAVFLASAYNLSWGGLAVVALVAVVVIDLILAGAWCLGRRRGNHTQPFTLGFYALRLPRRGV
jgi:hypothetical protein